MTNAELKELQVLWVNSYRELQNANLGDEYEHYIDVLSVLDLPDLLYKYVSIADINAVIKSLIFIQAYFKVIYDLGKVNRRMYLTGISGDTYTYLTKHNKLFKEYCESISERLSV